jgi:hypothetical protein
MSTTNEEVYYWRKNIFVLLGESDIELKNGVHSWAKTHNYNITVGIENTSDAIAFPSFIMIIDRNLLNEKYYAEFLKYNNQRINDDINLNQITEGNCCIFLDDIRDRENPKIDFIIQIRKKNKLTVDFVINVLNHVSSLIRSN